MKHIFILLSLFVTSAYGATETIEWYVGDTLYDTTTCQSGGDVNLPSAPSNIPYGYEFSGWKVKYDFSKLDYMVDGTSSAPGERYSVLRGAWSTTFPYGTIFGEGLASPSSANTYATGNPIESSAEATFYCWCRVTGYQPTNSNIVYEPSQTQWVMLTSYGSSSACKTYCPTDCGLYTKTAYELRHAMFGQ